MKLRDLKVGDNVELTVRMNVRIDRVSNSHGLVLRVDPENPPGWANRQDITLTESEILDCVASGERRNVFVFRDGEQLNFVEQLKANLLVADQWFIAEKLARMPTGDPQAQIALLQRDETRDVELNATKEALATAIWQRDALQAALDNKLEPIERAERERLRLDEKQAHEMIDKLGDSSDGSCTNAMLHAAVRRIAKLASDALAHRDYTDQCNSELIADNNRQSAEIAKLVMPIEMRIHCPDCGNLHIDEGEFATKPHHTHACQACGLTWRPAIVPTVGVRFLPGFKNDSTDG